LPPAFNTTPGRRETQYKAVTAALLAGTPRYTDFIQKFAVIQLINIFIALMELTG